MDSLILSVDLGTTSIKQAIVDTTGNLIADVMREYTLDAPRAAYTECSEEVYWNAFCDGLAELLGKIGDKKEKIAALGISAQGETLFFLDEAGKSLRKAIVWMDNRAADEAAELTDTFTDELCYEITGQVGFDPCWPAAKILWVRRHEPEVFEKTAKFMLIEDWLIYRLTGQFVSEGSLLCSTVYWNIRTKQWWPEMLEHIGIVPEQLPKIMEPGEAVGAILPEMADALGLPRTMTVCTGMLDQAACAIGVGNIKEGMFSENIGAALAICAPMSSLRYDPNRKMPVHYFGIPDMYMLHTFTTGGMALKWFRDAFCDMESMKAEEAGVSAYYLMDEEAEQVEPGCSGLVALPHLSGSMAPDVNAKAKGVFYGFTLKHSRAHFVRAIMESLGFIIRRNIEAIENTGLKVIELRSSGGGSKSPFWNQIKADIIQRPLITLKESEAGCLGAAIAAGAAVGIFDSIENACSSMAKEKRRYMPDEALREIYDRSFENYKALFGDLNRMFERTYTED